MQKKILFIITKSEIGGAQKFVKEQVEILLKNGIECFLCTNQMGWLTKELDTGLKSSLIHKGIEKLSLSFLFNLRKFLLINKIDLVVCNSANGGFYGRIAAFLTGKKSIYISHGWSSVYNGGKFSFLYNQIERFLAYLGSNVLCISQNDYLVAKEKLRIQERKLFLISNCIKPIAKYDRKDNNDAPIRLLTVARMQYPKRIDLLIEALKKLPALKLSVVGDGIQFVELHEKIINDQIFNVELLGRIDSFESFGDYDIFVLISESEGLPLSALEAMSCGNALVLSDVGGCYELIEHNGCVVKNTVEDIVKGINLCCENLVFFKNNSLKLFDHRFNLDKNSDKYFNYYNKFL